MERMTSRANPFIRHMLRLCASRKYRREQGRYVCDGEKLFDEAVKSGATILSALVSEDRPDLIAEAEKLQARIVTVPAGLFAFVSPAQTPQGILLSCALPPLQLPPVLPAGAGHIVLDGIQDPGNIGTVLRTADALGIASVILSGGCVDPYNPKAVRSAMGALFRLPVYEATREEAAQALRRSGVPIYVADNRPEAKDARTADLYGSAVVIGSESQGVSDTMRTLSDGAVKIPIRASSESLNAAVAAALLMWEMSRGRQ